MICAIVPIKHESTRVPKKNYRDFNGYPLYYHILHTLLQSTMIDKIVVDTNSDVVKEGISMYFNSDKIIIYDRPEYLWAGDTPVNKLLINVINSLNLNAKLYIQTHTTNPLLEVSTIDNSIKTYLEKENDGYDSLFSVKKIQTRFYHNRNDKVIALNHNPNELIPTQDLEPIYEENSCIYIFTKDILVQKNHRVGYNPYMFIMSDIESQDIDTESDFLIAQILHKGLNEVNKNNNKTVLITGINGGIGSEIAKKYKKNHWNVIGTDISSDCSHEYFTTYISTNLINKTDIENMVQKICDSQYEKIDCIVHVAALQHTGEICEFDDCKWDDIMNCNLKSIFRIIKYSSNLLKKSSSPNIINIASVHSVATSDKIAAYACSKAAIVGFTKNLAIELSKFGIRVNSVSPGAIDTSMLREGLKRDNKETNIDTLLKNIKSKHLLGDIGYPSNISELVYQVCENNFINGANYVIDGGASVKLSTE